MFLNYRYVLVLFLLLLTHCRQPKKDTLHSIDLPHEKELLVKAKAFQKEDQIDSAYYYFSLLMKSNLMHGDSVGVAKTNINLLALEYKMNDFPSTERRCVDAIQFGKRNHDYYKVCDGYNFLGLSALNQQKYDEALYNLGQMKAYYPLLAPDTMLYYLNYHTNIGNVHHEMKHYTQAIASYDAIMAVDSILIYGAEDYARALDNKAKSMMEYTPDKDVLPMLLEALEVRKKVGLPSGLVTSYIHLSQYYLRKKQNDQAIYYALQSIQTCRRIHNVHDELTSLLILSQALPNETSTSFKRYAFLRDSLMLVERTFKDNAARIRFETREKEQEIVEQKQSIILRNRSLLWGAFLLVISLLGAFTFWKQKRSIDKQKTQVEIQNKIITELKREVHHRVKNDLKRIILFVNEKNKDAQSTILNELNNKIKSMLYVHLQLLESNDSADIDLQSYFNEIVKNVINTYQDTRTSIVSKVETPYELSYDRALLLGLMVNELLTNSFKYAFHDGLSGTIMIHMIQEEDHFTLTYTDDGQGFPKEFNIQKLTTKGLKLIDGLSKQLRGTFRIVSVEKGVQFEITFPKGI
jgi:two-component sensor histidine kinase